MRSRLGVWAGMLIIVASSVGILPAPAAAVAASITGIAVQNAQYTDTLMAPAVTFQAPQGAPATGPIASITVSSQANTATDVTIATRDGSPLAVGTYDDATWVNGTGPVLEISNCIYLTGSFTVLELEAAGGQVTRLAFRYRYQCGGPGSQVEGGDYRWNSTIALVGPSLAPTSSGTSSFYTGFHLAGVPTQPMPVTVSNKGTADLTISSVVMDDHLGGVFAIGPDTCSGSTVSPGSSCEVGIVITPPSAGGYADGFLEISSPDTGGPVMREYLAVHGNLQASVTITTPDVVRDDQLTYIQCVVEPAQYASGEIQTVFDGVTYNGGYGGLLPLGPHQVTVLFHHDPSAADPQLTDAEATKTITSVHWVYIDLKSGHVPGPITEGAQSSFSATLSAEATPASGVLRIRNKTTGAVLASTPVTGTTAETDTPSGMLLPIGDNEIVAEFVGDPTFFQATNSLIQTVLPDDAVNVVSTSTSPTTFYPAPDGYRDKITVKGIALEQVTATLKVINSTNHVVRTISLGSKHGVYATTWNGLTATGSRVAAGRYTVRQVLKDAKGNVLDVDTMVTLSWRQVKWVAVTRYAYPAKFGLHGKSGSGWYSTSSSFSGGLRISGGTRSGDAWVLNGWTLHSGLAYKSLVIAIYGRGTKSSSTAVYGFYGDQYGRVAGAALGWYRWSGSTSHIHSGHITVVLEADGPMQGAFDAAKLRVTYAYAVWK